MPLLEQVLERYPRDVRLVYKAFPLRNHNMARPAVTAALAAAEQGKFWEFHDALFRDYSKLNEAKIQEIATSLGLDLEAFETSRKSRQVQDLITRDVQEGQQIGVRGTPTLYVNGRLLRNRSLAGFQEAIDRELAKGGSGSSPPTE